MFIVVHQSIVLHPCLSSLFVFLIVVCHCCPLSSSLFVLVVVRHPPRLRRQGWRDIHPNIIVVGCCSSASFIVAHCCYCLPSLSFIVAKYWAELPLGQEWIQPQGWLVVVPKNEVIIVILVLVFILFLSPSIHLTIKPLYHFAIVPSHQTIEPSCHLAFCHQSSYHQAIVQLCHRIIPLCRHVI